MSNRVLSSFPSVGSTKSVRADEKVSSWFLPGVSSWLNSSDAIVNRIVSSESKDGNELDRVLASGVTAGGIVGSSGVELI